MIDKFIDKLFASSQVGGISSIAELSLDGVIPTSVAGTMNPLDFPSSMRGSTKCHRTAPVGTVGTSGWTAENRAQQITAQQDSPDPDL